MLRHRAPSIANHLGDSRESLCSYVVHRITAFMLSTRLCGVDGGKSLPAAAFGGYHSA